MAQPMLRRLKERSPDSIINIFAAPWVAPVLERMAEVHRIVLNPFGHGDLNLRGRWQFGRQLRLDGYDQAIVLPNSLKSALIPFFAGIPLRTGYVGELRYGLLNDARPLDKHHLPLLVERFSALAGERESPSRHTSPYPYLQSTQDQQHAALSRLGLAPQKPVAVFCPGAEYGPAKRWPATHFAELAKQLSQSHEIWLLGSGKDAAIGEEIALLSNGAARNLCGKTGLGDAIDLLAAADQVVSNDSGLMHIAAALDKPLLALFGSSSPGYTPPLSKKASVLSLNLPCSPCFKRECPLGHLDCLQKLTPQRVYEEMAKLKAA
ncbi:MAG: lipopolysaccharide heptosyltransferase II [Sulfuricellaceae bacterium]|nr:lipopolysaccharide heptosyltransferase II [Sulfuricellaceae bacterium]